MKVFLIMFGKSLQGGGGAERRFLRVFNKAKEQKNPDTKLVINRELFDSAKSLGLVLDDSDVLIYEDDKRFNYLRFSVYSIKTIIKEKPNIVHLVLLQRSQFLLHLFLLFRRKKHNVKVVTTIASYLYAYEINLKFTEKLNYRLITMASDYLDSLYSNIQLKSNKISVTPCSFTDYEVFSPSDKQRIVVFSGRLIKEKNPKLYLEAINELINVRNDLNALSWKFYIMGDGPLKPELQAYVEEKRISNVVNFTYGDSSKILKKSQIFVSLQQYENYPSQSLIEAIASKNVIIATDVGDTRKIVNQEYAKLISPDVKSLTDALISLFDKESELDTLAERSMIELKEKHNINIFFNYLTELWSLSI